MNLSSSVDESLPTATHTNDGRPVLFYVKALYDYTATVDQEFDFRTGDIIAVTDTPADGWWRGQLMDHTRRQTGRDVFPSNYVLQMGPPRLALSSLLKRKYTDDGRPILFYVKALYDYSATIDEEFDFKAGDIIAVTHVHENGWWKGELLDYTRKQAGRDVFPSNYVLHLGPPRQESPYPLVRSHTDDGWPILFYVEALYDYSATIDEELDFRAGDMIAVTDAPEDGWWSGELVDETRRETGRHVLPCNYVRVI